MNRLECFDPIPTEGRRRRDAEFRSRTDDRKCRVAARIGGSAEIDFERSNRKQASAAPKIGARMTVVSPELQGRPFGVGQRASSILGIQMRRKRRFVQGGFALKVSRTPVAVLPIHADSIIGYHESTRCDGDLPGSTFAEFADRHTNSDIHGTSCYSRVEFAVYVEWQSESSRCGPQSVCRAHPAGVPSQSAGSINRKASGVDHNK